MMMMTSVRSGSLASLRHVALYTKTLRPYQHFIGFLHSVTGAHFTYTLYKPCISEHIVHAVVISVSSRVNVCKMTSFHCLPNGRVSEETPTLLPVFLQTLWQRFMCHSVLLCMHLFLYVSLKTAVLWDLISETPTWNVRSPFKRDFAQKLWFCVKLLTCKYLTNVEIVGVPCWVGYFVILCESF